MIKRSQGGFTLVEIIIAMAVFSFALTIVTASVIGLIQNQRRAAADRFTQQNTRRAIEEIARQIRTGNDVTFCGNYLYLTTGDSFTVFYIGNDKRLYSGTVQAIDCLSPAAPADSIAMTSPEVNVTKLTGNRYYDSNATGANPKVSVDLELTVAASGDPTDVTDLQTTVSLRGQLPSQGDNGG